MAALQGQVTGEDISGKIYSEIMNIPTPSSRPNSKRVSSAKSSSTHISFPASPRNSARSKTPHATNQAAYSDFDIIKSRSWSGAKLRNKTTVKGSASVGANQPTPHSALVSPARSPVVTPTASASRGLTTPRRGFASAGSSATGISKESEAQGKGSQVERLHQEWAALEHCRAMKRASEIVQHRLDPMYRLSGSPVPLLHRYHVNDVELQKLRDMAETSRLLQHDLKRIKFPHTGPRTPRKERNKSKGRSQQRDAASAEGASENNNATNGEEADQQANNMETSPGLDHDPDAVHPSSPVSTPEPTPRPQGDNVDATSQASGQLGELTQQDTAEQGEANGDEGEVNTAGEEEEMGGDETQERTELDNA